MNTVFFSKIMEMKFHVEQKTGKLAVPALQFELFGPSSRDLRIQLFR